MWYRGRFSDECELTVQRLLGDNLSICLSHTVVVRTANLEGVHVAAYHILIIPGDRY